MATFTYVEYADGSEEYYDRAHDPNELHNVVGTLPARRPNRILTRRWPDAGIRARG